MVNRQQPVTEKEENPIPVDDSPFILDDAIFVRHQEKMIKVSIEDILYIEAERNYCRIFAKGKEYLLVMTLKEMDEKLPPQHFLRVHRSFIVNISQIEEIAASHVLIAKKAIPVSAELRKQLLQRIRKLYLNPLTLPPIPFYPYSLYPIPLSPYTTPLIPYVQALHLPTLVLCQCRLQSNQPG